MVLEATAGRAREVHALMWGLAAAFVMSFGIVPLQQILGVRDPAGRAQPVPVPPSISCRDAWATWCAGRET